MNITPTLPNPHAPARQEQRTIAPVQAPRRTRDAADQAAQQRGTQRVIDESRRAQLVARAETLATPHAGPSTRSSRALAAYSQVADHGERRSLRDLLGFDDYA